MLSLFTRDSTRLCDGFSRREAMAIGSLVACGLTLPGLLRARAATPPPAGRTRRWETSAPSSMR
jgi:hypothetical protein